MSVSECKSGPVTATDWGPEIRPASYTHSRAPLVPNRFGDLSGLGILHLVVISRNGFSLAGSLVLRQVELFLDFALAAGQRLVTLFMLEGSTDFGFEFLDPLAGRTMSDSSLAARSSKP